MNDNSNPNPNQYPNQNSNPGYQPPPASNQPEDYTQFGGLLLLWYWGLIAGGVLIILAMVIPSLISVFSLFV